MKYFHCTRCGARLEEKEDWCPHCSKIFVGTTCNHCGHYAAKSVFLFNHGDCPVCGTFVVCVDNKETLRCKRCHQMTEHQDLFCKNCGFIPLRSYTFFLVGGMIIFFSLIFGGQIGDYIFVIPMLLLGFMGIFVVVVIWIAARQVKKTYLKKRNG